MNGHIVLDKKQFGKIITAGAGDYFFMWRETEEKALTQLMISYEARYYEIRNILFFSISLIFKNHLWFFY
jgi:hypothetical protein